MKKIVIDRVKDIGGLVLEIVIAMIVGMALDFCFGDPLWMPHPVQAIGKGISLFEKKIRPLFPASDKGQVVAGGCMVVVVLAFSFGVPYGILWLAGLVHPLLRLGVACFMCYQILATRCLKDASMQVYHVLKTGDLQEARTAVGMIVGRDTKELTREEIQEAVVETVAENTSDGVVAPLLFFAIGGAPLAFLYKGINTMDSMVGYKNDKYLYFGRAAAKLDDLANYIPARITALVMVVAAGISGLNAKQGWKIYKRDRKNHISPNSAQPESVCAGALGIQLGGDTVYGGKVVHKATMGDPVKKIDPEDIPKVNRILYVTAIVTLVISVAVRWLAILLIP